MKKVSIQEEDITSINIHVPNIGATRYIQQILTDITGEIHGNETIAGDTVEKLDLTDIFIYYIQKNKNIHSFRVHIKHSQGLYTYWGTKLILTKLSV